MKESSPSPSPSKRACGKAHCRGSVALLVPGSVRIKHVSSTVLVEVVEAVVENQKITGHGIMQDDTKQMFASFNQWQLKTVVCHQVLKNKVRLSVVGHLIGVKQ